MAVRIGSLLILGLCAGNALAASSGYRPGFHPEQLKGPPVGRPNEVVVLGSPHLSSLPKTFAPEQLEPLLSRLAAWKPEVIAVEAVSGLQCDFMRRNPARYAESVASYCVDTGPAQAATGLDVPAANAEAERVLASWPASPGAADRRRLAALWLAAGERNSAVVQWLRLPGTERTAADGMSPELVAYLDKRLQGRDESVLVAATLAARLGLERVWAVDDHTADSPTPKDVEKAAGEAIMKAWDNPYTKARADADAALQANIGKPGGMLALFRDYNAPGAALQAYRSDFGAALMEPSPQGFGRSYVGYWETRNLRMVANIRDVLGLAPGKRLLAIVGASHKGYYEAYLSQMHDVQLVDVEQVLR
jgi:hypothetical protein